MVYSGSVAQYKEKYIEESEFIRSFGSLFHIAMIAIPAFLGFIYRKRISENIHSPALLRFGLYASLGLLFINFYSTTVASRLTIYMYFIPMMVYPALADAFGRRHRQMMVIGIICFHILILVTWFSFGNVSQAYIPYNNVLFE
jgi:drug/metabolite transporter (DMT)-like permease